MLKGVTFDNQPVKSKNDGGIYQQTFSDGVIWGCAITTTQTSVIIAPGELICAGRIIVSEGVSEIPIEITQDGYLRVKLQIDLNGIATTTEFGQITTPYDFRESSQFPQLVQETINDNGTIYEMELGVFMVSGMRISGTVRTFGKSRVISAHKLVADYTASANVSSISITGLDSDRDGGFYEVVLSVPAHANNASFTCFINGINTQTYVYTSITHSNTVPTGSTTFYNNVGFFHEGRSNAPIFYKSTLSYDGSYIYYQSNGGAVASNTSWSNTTINGSISWTVASNITRFSYSGSFPTGTRIQVYKR